MARKARYAAMHMPRRQGTMPGPENHREENDGGALFLPFCLSSSNHKRMLPITIAYSPVTYPFYIHEHFQESKREVLDTICFPENLTKRRGLTIIRRLRQYPCGYFSSAIEQYRLASTYATYVSAWSLYARIGKGTQRLLCLQ